MTKDLIEGAYYYTENGIEKAHYCEVNGVRELVTPKAEVLYPVPSYKKLLELKEASDGLSKLMFKSLMNRFVKADEERERLSEENQQLKELLRECIKTIEDGWMYHGIKTTKAEEMMTKIYNAIGEKK